jgi:hypothetical protein
MLLQARFKESETLLQKALQASDRQHIDRFVYVYVLLIAFGRLVAPRWRARVRVQIYRRERGDVDEDVARCLNRLGALYVDINDLDQARALH